MKLPGEDSAELNSLRALRDSWQKTVNDCLIQINAGNEREESLAKRNKDLNHELDEAREEVTRARESEEAAIALQRRQSAELRKELTKYRQRLKEAIGGEALEDLFGDHFDWNKDRDVDGEIQHQKDIGELGLDDGYIEKLRSALSTFSEADQLRMEVASSSTVEDLS